MTKVLWEARTAAEDLLDELEVRASPALKTAVKRVKKEIKQGDVFRQMGVFPSE